MGELIGYARPSTTDHKLALQLDALRAAGVQERHRYWDQASAARKDRPGLLACWQSLTAGDTLIVWKLDRLSRSLRHLIEQTAELQERGTGLQILEGPFAQMDTGTTEGRLMLQILGAFAACERSLMRDRVTAGLAAARARGRKGGRRPKLSPEQQDVAREMAQRGMQVTLIAKTLGGSRHTVYAAIQAQQSVVVSDETYNEVSL